MITSSLPCPSRLPIRALVCGVVLAATTIVGKSEVAPDKALPASVRSTAKTFLAPLPDRMPGGEHDTPALIELGRKLYFDTALSVNRSQSCNTCHVVDRGHAGVDGERTSLGAFGKRGGRNSPTVLNAGMHFAQFWDGRAPTLEEQAKGPILNPVEMAMPNQHEVLKRLGADRTYEPLFARAFPQEPTKITYDQVGRAIAAFERTLLTHDRLDDFLKGDDQALSVRELSGLKTFLEVGCTTCHNGAVIGGNSYQKLGLINSYENTQDLGRFEITKDDSDKLKFKVPSLRNVALTGPYFHDGAVAELDQAVRQMAWMQLGRQLNDSEANDLVAFLGALSDKSRASAAK